MEQDITPKILIIIFGPPAVGKMTVAYELAKRTGFALFHNHMTIELVLNFFDFDDPPFKAMIHDFRDRIFDEISKSNHTGMIFTYVWHLDIEADHQEIEHMSNYFTHRGGETKYVELEAEFEERLARNNTPFRLEQKPSKRDLKRSESNIRRWEGKFKMNSKGDFPYPGHLKIENTNLSPEEVVDKIIQHFDLAELSDS